MHRLFAITIIAFASISASCASGPESSLPKLTELQRTKSGGMDVVLLAPKDAIPTGKGQAMLEFQTRADHHLVDVGTVKAGASMEMAGMGPMLGSVFVNNSDTPGRYMLDTDLSMAGTWRLKVEWDGPAGTGSVTFPGTVR